MARNGATDITKPSEQTGDRRKTIRYRVKAQAIVRWKRSRGNYSQVMGVTRDISQTGVFVLTTTCPPVGSIIQMGIAIPELFNVSKRMVDAEMKVLRVEQDLGGEGKGGFSAVGKGFALRDVSKELSDLITDSVERLGAMK